MPLHDWTRAQQGAFHSFHNSWLASLQEALNRGLLPPDFYALSEQVASRMQSDVLTLQRGNPSGPSTPTTGGLAIAEAPPRARLRLRPDPGRKPRQPARRAKALVVRHTSDHRVVALIGIVSPANKDRRDHVRDLADKVVRCIESEIHALLIDVLPATRFDPQGIHGAVWAHYDTQAYAAPDDYPLTLASYVGRPGDPEAFVEPVAVGQILPDMPLFLCAERYVNVPLEATYARAFQGMPAFVCEALAARASPAG